MKIERKCGKLGGGRPPLGTSMHKDESTGANVAPTNQSDNGWRAQLSWQFPNCDRNTAHIQLCVCVCVWEQVCVQLCPLSYIDSISRLTTSCMLRNSCFATNSRRAALLQVIRFLQQQVVEVHKFSRCPVSPEVQSHLIFSLFSFFF